MCDFLNKFSSNEIRDITTKNANKKPNLTLPFTASWDQHGKEMCCETNHGEKLFFTLGFGTWSVVNINKVEDKIRNNIVFSFVLDEHVHIVLIDQRRFSKWKVSSDFSKSRGPDPLKDAIAFKNNILKNLKKKVFDKPIYEMLLDQKYFCGVGNYLRAVILNCIDSDPFQSARDYIEKNGEEFLDTVIGVIQESYELQSSGKMVPEWYFPYGSGESIKDKNGRTFWFSKKWKTSDESIIF
jgi:formamidopyrimidine-DNA glycosylase